MLHSLRAALALALSTFLATFLAVATAAAGEAVALERLRFADGIQRSAADLGPYKALVVYFCGHCPGARRRMETVVVGHHQRIEQERLPVQLICVTPDKSPAELQGLQKELGLTHAWIANDPDNRMGISLQNIWQEYVMAGDGGSARFMNQNNELPTGGGWRMPVEGIADERVRAVWWLFERGRPGAGAALAQGLKSPAKDACAPLLAAVQARRDRLVGATASIAAYEDLESAAASWTGMDAKEFKPVKDRLAALAKDPALKDELAARTAWQRIQPLLADANPKKQDTGKAALAELAKRYPATRYGRLAAGG
jgi:hypothetical protein